MAHEVDHVRCEDFEIMSLRRFAVEPGADIINRICNRIQTENALVLQNMGAPEKDIRQAQGAFAAISQFLVIIEQLRTIDIEKEDDIADEGEIDIDGGKIDARDF